MITLEELKEMNPAYDMRYGVKQSDVDLANMHRKTIERNLKHKTPRVGDLVVGTYYRGTQKYEHGVIERRIDFCKDVLSVCYEPYVPFAMSGYDEIRLSVSGGPFVKAHESIFKPCGEAERTFCDFGHCGPCGGGAFYFKAKVNKWELEDFSCDYPFGRSEETNICVVHEPRMIHAAEYKNWLREGDLFNVYFDDDMKKKGCAVYDGLGIATSIQRLEDRIRKNKSEFEPHITSLKYVVGEWVDVVASKAFKSENETNHKRHAVVTMQTDITGEPTLCLQLNDGEFVYVNDYIGLTKVGTNLGIR